MILVDEAQVYIDNYNKEYDIKLESDIFQKKIYKF